MVKGRIIKFDLDTSNPYFKERNLKKHGPPKNLIPHWCICEPIIRKNIRKGERLFFVAKGKNLIKGVVTVKSNDSELDARKKLGEEWYAYHRKEVCNHSREHRGKSREIPRNGNIIMGNPVESFWIKENVPLDDFRDFLPEKVFDSKRQMNNIPKFTNESQVDELFNRLLPYKSIK